MLSALLLQLPLAAAGDQLLGPFKNVVTYGLFIGSGGAYCAINMVDSKQDRAQTYPIRLLEQMHW